MNPCFALWSEKICFGMARNTYSCETNTNYQRVLDKIRDAIFVVSRSDGALLYSNSRAKEWFGANIGEALEDVLEYGLLESEEVEMEISTRYLSAPRLTLRSESLGWGRSDACLISMREISKQKRAEDAFLISKRKLNRSKEERAIGFGILPQRTCFSQIRYRRA